MDEDIMKSAGFGGAIENIKQGLCAMCATPVKREELKDALSKKEFDISGLCQKCQDEVFGR